MRRKTARAGMALTLVTLLGLLVIPGLSEAAVTSLSAPSTVTPLTSNSVRVKGTADPGVRVKVAASDALGASVSKTVFSASFSDPGTGVNAGDFKADLGLTNLGTHDGTDSTLSVTAVEVDASGNPISASFGPVFVVKQSATAGDVYAPGVNIESKPPSSWCRFLTFVPSGECYTGFNVNFGGPCPPPFNSDPPPRPLPEPFPELPRELQRNPFKNSCPVSSGVAQYSGYANDVVPGSFGRVSEINRVTIKIERTGTQPGGEAPGLVFERDAPIERFGPQAGYSLGFRQSDLGPGNYRTTIVAVDALGNKGPAATHTFTIQTR